MLKEKIQNLVNKYEGVKNSGKLKFYTEEQTKKDFILPLFEILGWDVYSNKEVSAEETISSERVDYGFYLNDRIKFYLEAKKFNADIHDEKFANQAIKYSFNKGVTWAILTNFETLIVFNAQNIDGKLSDKKFFEITCNQFIERLNQLTLLSKESFDKDLLDQEAEKVGKKIQKLSVTNLLYKDLQNCRNILTKDLGQWNDTINSDLLDEGVQKLLDRLLFIRVAEDRGIEPQTLIPMVRQARGTTGKHLYQAMSEKFREFDSYYNSNLFSPHPFEQWEEYSGATEKVINILYGKQGYYEYDFKAMPADILGTVYENYLSHRLSKSKKGTTLSKDASKRKEEGIYYTPRYIVDYVVKNTLCPILDKCKNSEDIRRIKILDPACGSGSFLIKAFEVVFEKYREMGFSEPEDLIKIKILKENIYGVDLDQQAVEITRLNLLINALSKREKLPFLNNIKNGNSLVSGTEEELKKYFGKNFKDKKPFNWKEEFSEVFEQEGFDVIIGNPPYVNLANIEDADFREYLKNEYKTAKNKSDLYSFFIEKSSSLLKNSGNLGFITSNSWLGTDSFSKFREFLIKNLSVTQMVELSIGVFEHAAVIPVLVFLEKKKPTKNNRIKLYRLENNIFKKLSNSLSYEDIVNSSNYNFSFSPKILITIPTIKLGDIAKFSLGIKTSDDKKFILDEKIDNNCYKLLRGKDVSRYNYNYAEKWLWYKPELMLEKKGAGPRKLEYFLRDKILFRDVAENICAIFDDEKYLSTDTLSLIYDVKGGYNLKFIIGLLNSKFINKWYLINFQSGLHIKINELQNIPIPKIDFSNKKEKENHDELVKLINKLIENNKELKKMIKGSEKWISLNSENDKIDQKIDKEIYKLYQLSDDDINIIEKII